MLDNWVGDRNKCFEVDLSKPSLHIGDSEMRKKYCVQKLLLQLKNKNIQKGLKVLLKRMRFKRTTNL